MQLKYFIKVIENLMCGAKCISLNAGVNILRFKYTDLQKKKIPNSKEKCITQRQQKRVFSTDTWCIKIDIVFLKKRV